jgi:hypothetical protein
MQFNISSRGLVDQGQKVSLRRRLTSRMRPRWGNGSDNMCGIMKFTVNFGFAEEKRSLGRSSQIYCHFVNLVEDKFAGHRASEFGFSGRYFIIHARCPQSQFHLSSRVPGLAGHLPMPSVNTLSPVISISSSCFTLRL